MFRYTLVRSRRRTVAIHITKDAKVEVRAPLKLPVSEIDRVVTSKEKWIAEHLEMRDRRNSERAAFSLNYGDTVTFAGKQVEICAKDGEHGDFDDEHFYIPSNLQPEAVKREVIRIYKAAAKQILTDRVAEYAGKMDVRPTAVKINSAKTRWGSCSGKNSISFSWQLMMADENVIDYIVVHELAHIKEHNHSSRFWAVVTGVLPDAEQRKRELKILQERLSREDWD